MPLNVTACSVCAPDVKKAFDKKGIPYSVGRSGRGQKFSVNCSSPSSWPSNSLMATCWRQIQFTYHAAQKNGANGIKCSNC